MYIKFYLNTANFGNKIIRMCNFEIECQDTIKNPMHSNKYKTLHDRYNEEKWDAEWVGDKYDEGSGYNKGDEMAMG